MKKFLAVCVLILSLVSFLVPTLLLAAGSVTTVVTYVAGQGVKEVKSTWIGDASTGAIPDYTFLADGWVWRVVTDPGTTAPQANYDVYIKDKHGLHLNSSTILENRSATVTEEVFIKSHANSSVDWEGTYVFGNVTVSHANSTVASGTGIDYFYIREK